MEKKLDKNIKVQLDDDFDVTLIYDWKDFSTLTVSIGCWIQPIKYCENYQRELDRVNKRIRQFLYHNLSNLFRNDYTLVTFEYPKRHITMDKLTFIDINIVVRQSGNEEITKKNDCVLINDIVRTLKQLYNSELLDSNVFNFTTNKNTKRFRKL